MNFLHLKYFLLVAEELNITRAAERLYISQQSLSNHISNMEKELDVKLFTRSPKLSLTYAGDLLVETATQILDLHSQYLAKVGDINRHYMGLLRLGISHTCGLALLPDILPKFQAEFPMVEFSLFEGNSTHLEDELAHGRVDLIICFQPIMMEGVEVVPLTEEELILVVPKIFTDQLFGDRAEEVRVENGRPAFTAVCGEKRVPVRLNVLGLHNVSNAMAALAAAEESGIPMENAAAALEEFRGFQHRQQIFEKDGITVLDDTYNASPVSMKAAIEVLAGLDRKGRHIAVLADMKELGEETERFHYEVGAFLKDFPVDVLVTCGELAARIGDGAEECGGAGSVRRFLDREEMADFLKGCLQPGDCVLFKGSNSMGLSKVAERFYKE